MLSCWLIRAWKNLLSTNRKSAWNLMKLIISRCEKWNKFIMDVCCRKCNFYWNMKLLSDLAREIGFSHFMYIVKIWHIPWTFGDSFNRRFNFAFETSKCVVTGSITWMARVYNAYIQRRRKGEKKIEANYQMHRTVLIKPSYLPLFSTLHQDWNHWKNLA